MELYLLYTLVGRLFIYLLQKSPYHRLIKWGFLQRLFECDLCLGVWVYTILAFLINVNLFSFYVQFLSELIIGSGTSLIVHLIRIGWQEKFGTIVIS